MHARVHDVMMMIRECVDRGWDGRRFDIWGRIIYSGRVRFRRGGRREGLVDRSTVSVDMFQILCLRTVKFKWMSVKFDE